MGQYTRQWDVESTSSSKHRKFYVVSLKHDDTWQCSCPAWTRNSPREDCKHILRIRLQESATKAVEVIHGIQALVEVSGRKFR